MSDQCDARILIGPATHTSDGLDWIATCEKPTGHDATHIGLLDHTITTYSGEPNRPSFEWGEDDRRTFHGDYPGVCGDFHATQAERALSRHCGHCILPTGHRGNHAV